MERLDEKTFGLTALVDGATATSKSLLNTMFSGVNEPCCVVAVRDCTTFLSHGQHKTGEFIACQMTQEMDPIDPNASLFDCINEGGDSNFESGGRHIQKLPLV